MEGLYDVIILGGGPAGLSAGLYAGRSRLKTLLIEKGAPGGQIALSADVENYPGQVLDGETGFTLSARMAEQCARFGVERVTDTIRAVQLDGAEKRLTGGKGEYRARTLIIATGASPRPIGCENEKEFVGRGVSYCATCDGAFFRNRTVAVVGGGDVALEDAIFLARSCEKVYLIHRRDELRGAKSLQETVFKQDNIEILWDTVVEEITGEGRVERLRIKNKKTLKERELSVQGVFIAVGIVPNSQRFEGLVDMEKGYIKAGEDGRTSAPGIFAAGDVRTKPLRQIVTAAADGANAVISAERYLMGQ